MLKHKKLLFFLLVVPLCILGIALWYFHETRIIALKYEGFTVWVDCSKRGAVKFRYVAKADHGNLERLHSFSIDQNVPAKCQQTSTAPYTHQGVHYDRGHLVPANHMDHSATALRQSNLVTNILPQASDMNRGAWLRTEEIIECSRDQENLLVVGGVIWGNNKADDYFVKSHGVATPDAFWKVIKTESRVIAWIVPNTQEATRGMLDTYIVSVAELERRIRENVSEVSQAYKNIRAEKSWPIPAGCSKK